VKGRICLKENLHKIRGGVYVSKDDDNFWRKILRFDANDGEANYHVGLEYKQEAAVNLAKYEETKDLAFREKYLSLLKRAESFFERAYTSGVFLARRELKEIKAALTKKEVKKSNFWERAALPIFLAGIATAVLLIHMFSPRPDVQNNFVERNNTFIIPYTVLRENPPQLDMRNYEHRVVEVPSAKERDVVDALLGAGELARKNGLGRPLSVLAVKSGDEGIVLGQLIWERISSPMQVFLMTPRTSADESPNEPLILLRSALYRYVEMNGVFPEDLSALTQALPGNHLSAIPKDPVKTSNLINAAEGEGGWLYSPPLGLSPAGSLAESVTKALSANVRGFAGESFNPITIRIYKGNNRLRVMSGDTILRDYPVALGVGGVTPEGEMSVRRRIKNPNGGAASPSNVFGSRALELSDPRYAIHGTNEPETIGSNVSQGCVRMRNEDIEDVFRLTPLGTPVFILPGESPEGSPGAEPAPGAAGLLGDSSGGREESRGVYGWRR